VDRYRRLSVSLTSDAVTGVQLAPAGPFVAATIGASGRVVFYGFVASVAVSVGFENPSGMISGTVAPSLALGYAIRLADRVALTPSVRGDLFITFPNGTSANPNMYGEVATEVFVGLHAFIEPYIAAGSSLTNPGFTMLFGYRLGIVF
jgi:hypothetical protein